MDIILRDCGRTGWIGIVTVKDKEQYRTGKHYPYKDECLCAVNEWLNEREER